MSRELESNGVLNWLQRWYTDQANGEWEHTYGVSIDTLDNPGWRVKIDLRQTPLEGEDFQRVQIERDEGDWFRCWVKDGSFEAACGPQNLSEVIQQFQEFAQNESGQDGDQ